MDLDAKITDVKLTKVCSITPFEGAGESKQVTLEVNYEGLTLGDVFTKALGADVIKWQNGSGGRKNFDNLNSGQVVKISAKAPGVKPQVDPETAMVNKLAGMSEKEREEYIVEMLAKANS